MLAAYHISKGLEAGVDEAGRGSYAGPVVAAAVILPKNFRHPFLNDSKQLKPQKREELRVLIEAESIAYAVAMVDHTRIDSINILQATYQAMHEAIGQLKQRPDRLLIDGIRFRPYPGIPHHCMVKGDGKYASIAAASILAKTYRDKFMQELHTEYPLYGWDKNMGYGTAAHREAIAKHGLCIYHRKSFRIVQEGPGLF
ncbi:MAG TPA: ribonuclease HII [Chitinophagaceae bacterium]|nr:ribonuclease HII [Chitinophagaceae bacterium]HRF27763.1 ribonuclease HII [Ferruginibacter sp.]